MRVMHEASAVSRFVVRVRSGRRSCVALLATTVVFLAQPGAALNIVLNFESGKSDTFAADPGAANLTRIMQYVENYYEDVFEDSHTITINYWYDNITSSAGTLANHQEVSSSGGRETEADIRFDTIGGTPSGVRPWWYDPTPEDNSEFNMTQQLWRSLTSTQQTNLFNNFNAASIPDTFEVSYTGTALATGPAAGQWDILTSALHEVGHALGVNGPASASSDDDYDFNPDFLFGQTLAAETDFDSNGVPNGDDAHLEHSFAMMGGSAAQIGLRRLPSHVDLFAMASGDDWVDLDAPRREFYGNSNWNNNGNWTGNKVPGLADDVFIRDPQGASNPLNVVLTANGTAKNVAVSAGANLSTDVFTLTVDELFSVSDAGSNIFVNAGGTLDVEDLEVRFNAGLTVSGTLNVADDVTVLNTNTDLFLQPGGQLNADEVFLQGSAEIEVSGGNLTARRMVIAAGAQLETTGGSSVVNISQLLTNDSQIDTANGGQINFISAAANPWDLDGAGEAGVVDASDGNLNFLSGGLSDPFDGAMHVGAGHFLTIAADWTSALGTIDLNGGTDFASRARIGGAFGGNTVSFLSGTISASGVAHIDAKVHFFQLPTPTQVTVGADDSLDFNDDATVAGGDFTLGQHAQMRFNDPTTVSGGATFTLGLSADVFFNSNTAVTGSTFDLANDAGVFFAGNTTISGGTFNTFNNLLSGGFAIFQGATTYDGGTVTVNGIVAQEGHASVAAATTINADVFDMDGVEILGGNLTVSTWTLNEALAINAGKIDEADNVFNDHITINNTPAAGNFGKLIITLPGNHEWTLGPTSNLIMTGRLSGFSSVVEGSGFNVDGTAAVTNNVSWAVQADISGAVIINAGSNLRLLGGTVADPNRLLGGTISGQGTLSTIGDRALVGNGTIATDIDFSNQAELRADNGTLIVAGTINDVGVVGTADDDGTLRVTNPWNTNVADLVELRGGRVTGGGITNDGANGIRGFGTLDSNSLNNNSLIAAAGNGTLIVDTNNAPDLDGSAETGQIEAVNGSLEVNTALADNFNGTATVGPARHLTLASGWTLGNSGTLNLNGGATPSGRATVAGLTQTLRGAVAVGQQAAFDTPTDFQANVTVNLPDSNDALALLQDSSIQAGAAFTGAGRLLNGPGSHLTLADGAAVGVTLVNDGQLQVGNSPGAATVDVFNQRDSGTLQVELTGAAPGTGFDQLAVTQDVSLDGALDVLLPGGFVPKYGEQYSVLTYASRTGTFDTITGTFISSTRSLAPIYDWAGNAQFAATPDSLSLFVTAPGDANLDLVVDFTDLAFLASGFNKPGTWLNGDFNSDNIVDFTDLAFLASNFNKNFQPLVGTSFGAAATIPEPATLMVLIAIGTPLLRRRSRGQGRG